MNKNSVISKARQTGMSFTMTEEIKQKLLAMYRERLLAARFWNLGSKAPKIKGLRRKLAYIKTKPVPDTGVIYERAGTKYKVMPNGEWRRVQ
jgi:hypothetical protein